MELSRAMDSLKRIMNAPRAREVPVPEIYRALRTLLAKPSRRTDTEQRLLEKLDEMLTHASADSVVVLRPDPTLFDLLDQILDCEEDFYATGRHGASEDEDFLLNLRVYR